MHTHHFFHNMQCILSITFTCEYSVLVLYKHLLHKFTVQTAKLTTLVTRNLSFSAVEFIHVK